MIESKIKRLLLPLGDRSLELVGASVIGVGVGCGIVEGGGGGGGGENVITAEALVGIVSEVLVQGLFALQQGYARIHVPVHEPPIVRICPVQVGPQLQLSPWKMERQREP